MIATYLHGNVHAHVEVTGSASMASLRPHVNKSLPHMLAVLVLLNLSSQKGWQLGSAKAKMASL